MNKRVAIAKDVLLQLEARRFQPAPGTYCFFNGAAEVGTDLQKHLKKVKKCEVCALGALFVSAVRKYDDYEVGEYDTDPEYGVMSFEGWTISKHLEAFFPAEMLDEMEHAFECWGCPPEKWCALTPKARMRRIMKNVIKNKGDFNYDECVGSEVA